MLHLLSGSSHTLEQCWRTLTSDWFALLLATTGVVLTMIEYLRSVVGVEKSLPLDFPVWHRVATAVISGTPFYLGKAVDNKPPLFQFMQVAAAATGDHLLAFFVLTALVNGGVVYAVYLLGRNRSRLTGRLAALFVVSALTPVYGTIPNVRSFAVLAVLIAVLFGGASRIGGLLAVAGQFSQFAIFAVPWFVYRHRRQPNWIARAAMAGVVVTAISYLLLLPLGGVESLFAAIERTILNAGAYSTSSNMSPVDTRRWAGSILNVVIATIHLQLLFVVGLVRRRGSQEIRVLSVLLLLPLFVRSLRYYWVLPVPFMGVVAAIEVESWFD